MIESEVTVRLVVENERVRILVGVSQTAYPDGSLRPLDVVSASGILVRGLVSLCTTGIDFVTERPQQVEEASAEQRAILLKG